MTIKKENIAEFLKHYDPQIYEKTIYRKWERKGAFSAEPDERTSRYVIMMPLPNVTGALHMGHAMDNIMQDLLIRWHRMLGDNVLWMPGIDHAGIATQAVVEKRLFELEGKTRHDIGREALVEKIWAWKDEYKKRIEKQLKTMGCSCDWSRERFTMDKVGTRAVREAFYRLFKEGLIFRGNRLVNWDCKLQTAVSDDEIIYEKVQSFFWHIRYPVINPQPGEPSFITVATTRPETMLGDTAVACHPDPQIELEKISALLSEKIKTASLKDKPALEEEQKLIAQRKIDLLPHLLMLKKMALERRKVRLPLINRAIPLILDNWAKPELGSGCVKITPAHDPNDYNVWIKHGDEIDIINILNPDGSLNNNAGPYAKLDRFHARKKIISDLKSQGLLELEEAREIEIGHSDRSKSQIEPYFSKQWFIKMGDVQGGVECGKGTQNIFRSAGLAQASIDAISETYRSPSGLRLSFYPDHSRYSKTYSNWLSEKRDWCISRQLWWGHRIPIWHKELTVAEIKDILPFLPTSNDKNIHVWIADAEGTLYSPKEISKLAKNIRFNLLVSLRDQDSEKKYASILDESGLEQDPDVLDTWFSSSLWPFSTLGWPDPETAEVDRGQTPLGKKEGSENCLNYYYPGSCLVTGRDIITLWVARMQVMGLYFMGDVPFSACFVHANIQDGKGERMSKSKGNGIDPEDIIQKYGTDSMRYVLCEMQTGTQDIRLPVQAISPFTGEVVDLASAKHGKTIFTYICPGSGKEFDVLGTMNDMPMAKIISDRFEVGRAFCTKLWNAARFAMSNLGDHEFSPLALNELEAEDLWILSRLSQVIKNVNSQLENFNPSAAIGTARDFFWSEFCDWYLEFIKPRLKDNTTASSAKSVLSLVLDFVLRLFHPVLPFITEVLWERLSLQCPVRGLDTPLPTSELIISAKWPEAPSSWTNFNIETEFEVIFSVIHAIRELRARYNVSPGNKINAFIKSGKINKPIIARLQKLICLMGGLSALHLDIEINNRSTAAFHVVKDIEIYLEGLIDPEKETKRLQQKYNKLMTEIEKSLLRLNNANFLNRAPTNIVEAEKAKLKELKDQAVSLEKNLSQFSKKK